MDFDLTFFGVRVPTKVALAALIVVLVLGVALLPYTVPKSSAFLASIGTSILSIFLLNTATTTPDTDESATAASTKEAIADAPGAASVSRQALVTPGPETNTVYPLPDGPRYAALESESSGRPDLMPLIREVGAIDSNNNFLASSSVRANERGGIRFAIMNIGTATARDWYFNAVLPTYPPHTFTSQTQAPIRPGERIEFTLGFDDVNTLESTGAITINVNPARSTPELNYENNIGKATIAIIAP